MPIITAEGLPQTNREQLAQLKIDVMEAVASFLGIEPNEVWVFLHHDLLDDEMGEGVFVFIDSLYSLPGRGKEFRSQLRECVADPFEQYATDHIEFCELVEVSIRSMQDPEEVTQRDVQMMTTPGQFMGEDDREEEDGDKEDTGLRFHKGDRVEYMLNGVWEPGTVESPGDALTNMCVRLDRKVAGCPATDVIYTAQTSNLVRLEPWWRHPWRAIRRWLMAQ